jgi:L-alanine-DL-glutamate epimerase-like enolase superfamily enzyme
MQSPEPAPHPDAAIAAVDAGAYEVPTDRVESDGTLSWSQTTVVIAEVEAAGVRGLGYTYSSAAAVRVIRDLLCDAVRGRNPFDVIGAWVAMQRSVRNIGRDGVAATAISAVDAALWDLKCRLLQAPLALVLGRTRSAVPVYGSGGFTSYSIAELQAQFSAWVSAGIGRVKMKVGRDARRDVERVHAARDAIGPATELFVDANGAWNPAVARAMAEVFATFAVSWFEEPVSSDDLDGLARVRESAPPGMEVAAGEYGYHASYFRQMLEAGAVDVLQADATRCGGITGFLAAGALCEAFGMPLSAHTAPALHVAACCAIPRVRHLEYFHDHVRIEQLLFDGVPRLRDGSLAPDLSRPGLGLDLKRQDAERFRAH